MGMQVSSTYKKRLVLYTKIIKKGYMKNQNSIQGGFRKARIE